MSKIKSKIMPEIHAELMKLATIHVVNTVGECEPEMFDDACKSVAEDFLNGSLAFAQIIIREIENGKSIHDILAFCKEVDKDMY